MTETWFLATLWLGLANAFFLPRHLLRKAPTAEPAAQPAAAAIPIEEGAASYDR